MNPPLDYRPLPEQLNLAEVFLYRQLANRADAPALHTGDRTISYRELAEDVDRTVAVFRGLGLELEQRVLLMLPDIPEFASAWFATLKAGGVVAAINPEQRIEELDYYLRYTRAKIVVANTSARPIIDAATSRSSLACRVLITGGPPGHHLSLEREI